MTTSHFESSVLGQPLSLSAVPQAMLRALHHRASEAKRRDAFILDPDAVRLYESLAYDYVGNFGRPAQAEPMRARMFDRAVRNWIMENPGGTVVELGCGLETQFYRCDDGEVRWLCVDSPEALEVRERYLPPSRRCRLVAKSALDPIWMDAVDATKGLFVTAQDLFTHFEEGEVRALIGAIFQRFPGVQLMFDAVPAWLAQKHEPTRWVVARDRIEPCLRAWSRSIASVEIEPYGARRGLLGWLFKLLTRLPVLRELPPTVVRVRTCG